MADEGRSRYLVLSDMHFGTPDSSINDPRFSAPLIEYITSRVPWDEIIFAGDLLDINLATFTRAIEGGQYPALVAPLFGFRQFVQALDARMKQGAPGKGLPDVAKRWIYLPGNHDYKVWDMLATKIVCEDVLAGGKPMGSVPTPLMKYRWTGDESFFSGIFRRYGVNDRVIVEYPNHEIAFGAEQMVLTHGHYLDAKQTRLNDLSDHLRNATTPEEIRKAVRAIFIETAQYQSLANAVSFTRSTRSIVNVLFGPDNWLNKLKKFLNRAGGWLIRLLFPTEGTKGQQITPRHLSNIDFYLERFCGYPSIPRWFIFGHTHRQDGGKTSALGVSVYNAGSCYLDRGMPVTFIDVETDAAGNPNIQLMRITKNGKVENSV